MPIDTVIFGAKNVKMKNSIKTEGKMKKSNAFTLAEVLITLGIIGIVAAMTMPTLIQKNNNRVVETRLMKFYSAINQAVKMAEVDYGDKKIWFEDLTGAEIDKDGKPVPGSSDAEKWFNKYLAPYMKIIKTETLSNGTFIVYFPDGSALKLGGSHTTRDWLFYPGKAQKCIDSGNKSGVCVFSFNFYPTSYVEDEADAWKWVYTKDKGFEPWKFRWDGTEEQLKDLCYNNKMNGTAGGLNYCTTLIQINNWKIPDDYPYKVSY